MRLLAGVMCAALVVSSLPQPVRAQDSAATSGAASSTENQDYSSEQLDALLAPIALYPDQLLTQILMASTYPDEVKAADAWVKDPAHKGLTGTALAQALTPENWDPSVKSLVPFPQVLDMMSTNADWTAQLGYAMNVQQSEVMASVQRLRQQAQAAGQLNSSPQQTVSSQGSTIIIAPAQPTVVYVPVYNPTVVYGVWPYPAYPPVYYPPPPAYYAGSALVAGLAFGAGVAITAGLWGWATPNWGHGNINVNVNHYNNINVNRTQIHNNNWSSNNNWNTNNSWNGNNNRNGNGGNKNKPLPPGGPVGTPRPQKGMPANSIGRPSVSVPGNIAKPPAGMGAGNRPNGQGGNKPAFNKPATSPGGNKPAFNQGGAKPPSGMGHVNRPSTMPSGGRGPSAFNGMGDGRSASQFSNRGEQSMRGGGGERFGGGGGFARGGRR